MEGCPDGVMVSDLVVLDKSLRRECDSLLSIALAANEESQEEYYRTQYFYEHRMDLQKYRSADYEEALLARDEHVDACMQEFEDPNTSNSSSSSSSSSSSICVTQIF